LVPELFHRLVIDGIAHFAEHDPGQFTVMKVRVEGFEPINLLSHRLRDRAGPLPRHHLDVAGEEAQHALPTEATRELPHRLRMRVRFLGPLRGGAIGQQHQGANHLIMPLDLIHEVQLQLGKLRRRFHRCPFHMP
jgi:hypothetical protein